MNWTEECLEIDDLVIIVMGIIALKEEMPLIEEVIAKEDKINIYLPKQIYSE